MPFATIEAKREYQREWKAARRAEFFNGKCCARCGSEEDLQLDHLDPTKKVHHNIWSWSDARRLAELAKCQVLCWPCHKLKTKADKEAARRHGTHTMYRAGCRCGLCKLRHTFESRAWRAKRK